MSIYKSKQSEDKPSSDVKFKLSKNCMARQHSDQMICSICSLVWDVNDPEPPACENDN